MAEKLLLGAKIRSLRRRQGWTQADLAQRLEVSSSYLNLIEHNRRGVTAEILVKLARLFSWDLKAFSGDDDARLSADLLEVFGDSIFESQDLQAAEIRDLAQLSPAVARSVLALYQAYRSVRESAETLASRLSEGEDAANIERSLMPSEEVGDFVQHHGNYFPALEEGAELLGDSGLIAGDLFEGMVHHLDEHYNVEVRIETVGAMNGAIRRYDPRRRLLQLSESLRRGSRNFQVAYQLGLLTHAPVLDRLVADPLLTTDESRSLARVALANYFAGALLMPYKPFLAAAKTERYDIEVLGNRFRTSFEQVCHRLTTLHRPGAEGVPFHLVRIDVAGNISKRFSASGLRFARFSGACPRWNVFSSFVTPGMTRTQISQMPDGATYFWVARAIRKGAFGHHAPHTMFAIGLGCEIRHAHNLVYSDGVDLESREAVVPVGITCRICERRDCEQRAFPAIQAPLKVDLNVRGVSFYAPVGD
jgi:predicted transcriptional regulator/transcriptional regulator with XRE-family HTH domain